MVKLHGSLNWVYSGASSYFGETIYTLDVMQPWSSEWRPWSSVEQRAPGLVPLVVAPTPSKSPYFDNETIRALWQFAAGALLNARDLYVLGYSLPVSDLQTRGLLATTSASLESVTVCDPSEETASRFRRFLAQNVMGKEVAHRHISGQRAIQQVSEELGDRR